MLILAKAPKDVLNDDHRIVHHVGDVSDAVPNAIKYTYFLISTIF